MGSFDAYSVHKRRESRPRSVFRADVGPKACNTPEDLHIITRTLASAGLLDENTPPSLAYNAIFTAIRHVGKTLGKDDGTGTIRPGDATERAVRRAIAAGRLPLAHRAIQESTAPRGTRSAINGGMKRAIARLSEDDAARATGTPERRALLPSITPDTFRANRRLAEAIVEGGDLPGLDHVIAESIREGGKQGFSDVRDFARILEQHAPAPARTLWDHVEKRLEGKALRRFRKLRRRESPTEGDFDPLNSGPLS